jgi:hypothetical protein
MVTLGDHSISLTPACHSSRARKRSTTSSLSRHRKTRKKLPNKSEGNTLDNKVIVYHDKDDTDNRVIYSLLEKETPNITSGVAATTTSVMSSTINVDELPHTVLRPPVCCCCRRPWPTQRIDVVIEDTATITTTTESVPLIATSEPESLLNTSSTSLPMVTASFSLSTSTAADIPINSWPIAESGPSRVGDTVYQYTTTPHDVTTHVNEAETAEQIRAIEALMFAMDSDDNSSLDTSTVIATALSNSNFIHSTDVTSSDNSITIPSTTSATTTFSPIINEQSVLETTARLLALYQQQWPMLDLTSDTFSMSDLSSVLDTNATISTTTESFLLN